MKLVSVHSRRVVDFSDVALPPYAVLSYTHAVTDQKSSILGHDDFSQAYECTLRCGLEYIWIAELCIDRSSILDLDDAVNGSRRRLRDSTICFAYLHDLPAESTFDSSALWSRCRYWKRAWTLQELILCPRIRFYDCKWNHRGEKDSPKLISLLSRITNIPERVLGDSKLLSEISLGMQMSWLAGRGAEREEDTAYALVAITRATLPIQYGEGAQKAFLRLQEELLRDTRDGSLLAWQSDQEGDVRGLLARSPSEFSHFAPVATASSDLQRPWVFDGKLRFSSKGVELESRVCDGPGSLLLFIGHRSQDQGPRDNIAICLRERNGVYVRVAAESFVSSSTLHACHKITVARDVDQHQSLCLRSIFNGMPYRLDIAEHGIYDDCWQQGPGYLAVKEHEKTMQQRDNQDTEMKVEFGEPMVALTSPSYAPSDTANGNHLNMTLTGPSVGSLGQRKKQSNRHRPMKDDAVSDSDVDDRIPSTDSEMGGSAYISGCRSACSSDSACDIDHERDCHTVFQGFQHRNRGLDPPEVDSDEEDDGDVDDETVATETRSATTLATEQDDRNSLRNLIMRPSIRDQVLKTAYERFCHWIPTAQYIEHPADRLPPPSRINTSAWFALPESLTLRTAGAVAFSDSETSQQQRPLVAVFQPHGYFHLACPFYAADPLLHPSCVVDGQDLQSIGDVLRHVWQHHAWLPYCSRCYLDFERAEDRDAHLREQKCDLASNWPVAAGDASRKGVSESEVRQLNWVDMCHRDENETQRWWRIYWSLFPDLEEQAAVAGAGSSNGDGPYLRAGKAFAVSVAYDFWTVHREELVVAALELCGHKLRELNDHEALSALYQGTLRELVRQVYHEYRPHSNSAA